MSRPRYQPCTNCSSYDISHEEDGTVVCLECGMQREGYIEENTDADYNKMFMTNHGVYAKKRPTADQKSTATSEPVKPFKELLFEFLEMYQYLLLLHLKRTLIAAGLVNSFNDSVFVKWRKTLQHLWMRYLKAWSSRSCKFVPSSPNASKCSCTGGQNIHPLPPSRHLMLGFIYTTCRIHKSNITPADIVRWCQNGIIPMYSLLTVLPESKMVILEQNPICRQILVDLDGRRATNMVLTGNNIIFHFYCITTSIKIETPHLNSPLIARGVINDLGLTKEVWHSFVQVTQLFDGVGNHPSWLSIYREHHLDNILAVILAACKFCPWMLWSVYRYEHLVSQIGNSPGKYSGSLSDGTPAATDLQHHILLNTTDLNGIPRSMLEHVLQVCRRNTYQRLKYQKNVPYLNKAVSSFYEKFVSTDFYRQLGDCPLHWFGDANMDSTVNLSKFELYGQFMKLNTKKSDNYYLKNSKEYLERNALDVSVIPRDLSKLFLVPSEDSEGFYPFIDFLQHAERICKHFFSSPGIVFGIFEKFEKELLRRNILVLPDKR